jgi:hypothetical protein
MRAALYRMSSVDLTAIDAIGVEIVQVVLSEYGPDLSRFPTEKEFVSHVTLAPRRPMRGGKPVRKKSGTRRARGGICDGPEVEHPHVPLAPLGATVHG